MPVRFYLGLACAFWFACSSSGFAAGKATRPAGRRPAPKASSPATSSKGKSGVKTAAKPSAAATSSAPSASSTVSDDRALEAGARAYTLRYKFKPGETVRREVEHRAKVRSTVQGTTQTAETLSRSVKVWQVKKLSADGNATLVHSVERVDMTQKLEGRQDVHYNSETDESPPAGFENVAEAVGKELAQFVIDPLGKVIERQEHFPQAAPSQESITLPLPEVAVSVGQDWTMPADIVVTLPVPDEPPPISKKIKARQLYRLESVDNGIAVIHMETQVLTPIHDPKIESQLAQSKASGTVRFDIAAGRVVSQQSDVDEHVHGFQGEASSMHYVTRFSEKLVSESPRAVLPRGPAKR